MKEGCIENELAKQAKARMRVKLKRAMRSKVERATGDLVNKQSKTIFYFFDSLDGAPLSGNLNARNCAREFSAGNVIVDF